MLLKFLLILSFVASVSKLTLASDPELIIEHSYKEKLDEANQAADLNSPFYKGDQLYHAANDIHLWQHPPEFEPDDSLGAKHRKSVEIRHIKRTSNQIIFDSIYTFDKFGRRYTKIKNPQHRKKFLILYGCSITYGNGLNDNETINYFLAERLKDYWPYNYAIGATGPNTMLALIEKDRFHSEVPQEHGIFIYIYIESHIDRSNGYLPSLTWNNGHSPYYEMVDGKLQRNGFFDNGRYYTSEYYKLVYKMLKLIGRDNLVFPKIEEKEARYTCEIIAESKRKFLLQYPQSKFFVYAHHISKMNPDLEKCLLEKSIKVVIGEPSGNPDVVIKGDGHPNAMANKIASEQLEKVIREIEVK